MAAFWGWAVAVFGLLGAMLYALLLVRAREQLNFPNLLVGLCIVCVCLYAGILWGAQMLGWFRITAELGRPALALALLALVWLGLLALAAPRRK